MKWWSVQFLFMDISTIFFANLLDAGSVGLNFPAYFVFRLGARTMIISIISEIGIFLTYLPTFSLDACKQPLERPFQLKRCPCLVCQMHSGKV